MKLIRPLGQVPTQAGHTQVHLQAKSIVWAVDPFAGDPDLQMTMRSILAVTYPEAAIYPVFVLSEEAFHEHGGSAFLRPALKPQAVKLMEEISLSTTGDSFKKPRVLLETSASRSSCAKKLARFSEKLGASVIALSSHARRSVSQLFIGSFYDELIHSSETPLLFNGPASRNLDSPPGVIVFPTDFSVECARSLDKVITLARQFNVPLHLFHKSVHNVDPIVQSGVYALGGGWVSLESVLNDEEVSDTGETEAKKWIERANLMGVEAQFVSEPFKELTSQAIVDYVSLIESRVPMLAMVSHTGPMAGWLLGSVTKDVIRRSPCPVYVT